MPVAATVVGHAYGRSACKPCCAIGWDSRSPCVTSRRVPANPTPDPAPEADSFTNEVTITDRAHPFFGQKLPGVFRGRTGRRDHVLVKLPGGGRRAIPIAATSLADHISALDDRTAPQPSLVSVRTLLPVAQLVRALKRRGTEVPNAPGHRSTPTDARHTSGDDPATGVDGSADRTAATRRSHSGRACPSDPPAAST